MVRVLCSCYRKLDKDLTAGVFIVLFLDTKSYHIICSDYASEVVILLTLKF